MRKRITRISLIIIGGILLSIIIQFLCNIIFVKEYVAEPELDGDSLLNTMLYESDKLDDSYFKDSKKISNNLAGTSSGGNL